MWLVGIELVGPERRISGSVQCYKGSDFVPFGDMALRWINVDHINVLIFTTSKQNSLIDPHSVRVPSKIARSRARYAP